MMTTEIFPISFWNFANWNLRSNMAQAIAFMPVQSLFVINKITKCWTYRQFDIYKAIHNCF
jgi:hypothetical protein